MKFTEADVANAHHYFSASCFNGVWGLLDKPDRTSDDDQLMVSMCHASLFHWLQRPDCTPRNLSIGYWQLSRVYAVLREPELARRYGHESHKHGQNEGPFYMGYALEAIARAEFLAGNTSEANQIVAKARQLSQSVSDQEDRKMLDSDLDSLQIS
jgi:hypothetical protein